MPTKTDALSQASLGVDPWGDGKGDDPYRVFRNALVVTRKPSQCALCFQPIRKGSRVRAQTECGDGKVMTFKFCPACVRAMGRYRLYDDFKGLEKRYALGFAVADSQRVGSGNQATHDH
jgi:hypothetical protein